MNLFSVSQRTGVNFGNLSHNTKKQGIAISLPYPCDTFIKSKNNISFCGKYGNYDFKNLPKEELDEKRKELLEKSKKMGIALGPCGIDWYNSDNANIAIQAINVLLDHKIMENPTVADHIFEIAFHIKEFGSAPGARSVLEFADFITSDEYKEVYENQSIQDSMGDILENCTKDTIKHQKDLVKFIAGHKELLSKDINLGDYICMVNADRYDAFITELSKTEPGYDTKKLRKEIQTTSSSEPFSKLKTDNRVMTKKEGEISGFARIGGQAQAIQMLERSVIWPRKFPQLYKGRSLEKGAILYGPPGTGKSLMATAFAEEYGAYCVKIGASEMSEKWVGASEENWRNLFKDLKEHQPALLFIDEMDALCKKRGSGDIHGDKELNQFLKLVSDIKAENLDVFILGATNNYESLDPAVIRDGRFGLHIPMLPPQDEASVGEIFDIHSRDLKLDDDVREKRPEFFKKILDLGLTGSGIEALISEAHDEALSRLGLFEKMRKGTVTQEDYDTFSIKTEDIMAVIDRKKNEVKSGAPSGRIGFIQ